MATLGRLAVLALKLLLAPALIAAATYATRRWGLRIGGLIATLPAAAGPILLVIAIQEGAAFAADTARSALLGIVALNAFILVYCLVCRRVGWFGSLLIGWAAFFVMIVPLREFDPSSWLALVIAFVANTVTLVIVWRMSIEEPVPTPDPPRWDIPARALSAVVMIVVITGLAAALGPDLTGMLTPFPIIASILAAFTHASAGGDATIALTRAFGVGLYSFAVFFFVLAETLVDSGVGVGFTLAIVATLIVQLIAFGVYTGERPAVEGVTPEV